MRPDRKDLVHDIDRVYFVVKADEEEEEVLGDMNSSLVVSVSIYPLSSCSLQDGCHHHHW